MGNIPAEIQTERLWLRPLTVDDAAALFPIYSHPEAMRFWDTPPHENVTETAAMLTRTLHQGSCWWAICFPNDERVIGNVGYLLRFGTPV